jgi:hypothetical protein
MFQVVEDRFGTFHFHQFSTQTKMMWREGGPEYKTRNSPILTDAVFVPAPGKDSAQISQLIGVASDFTVRFMGDKSPKSKNKQAVQKQAKAAVESQKKKDAVSAKQIAKTKK